MRKIHEQRESDPEVLGSVESPDDLDRDLRVRGTSLRCLAREIPPVFGSFFLNGEFNDRGAATDETHSPTDIIAYVPYKLNAITISLVMTSHTRSLCSGKDTPAKYHNCQPPRSDC